MKEWYEIVSESITRLRGAKARAEESALAADKEGANGLAYRYGAAVGIAEGVAWALEGALVGAPKWTLGEVQHYLEEEDDEAVCEVLSALISIGPRAVAWGDLRRPCLECQREPGAHERWCGVGHDAVAAEAEAAADAGPEGGAS